MNPEPDHLGMNVTSNRNKRTNSTIIENPGVLHLIDSKRTRVHEDSIDNHSSIPQNSNNSILTGTPKSATIASAASAASATTSTTTRRMLSNLSLTDSQPEVEQKSHKQNEVMIDEEMANKNICIGMIKTDIVVEYPPLILIKDDQYEIVKVVSEGRLPANNYSSEGRPPTNNYSFCVSSREVPYKFFGWLPFADTKVLGPLVDHKLIWWDAVIPRGLCNKSRSQIYLILYCKPQEAHLVCGFFQKNGVLLKRPPFYNLKCRYNNPHERILYEQQQQHQLMNGQQYRYSGTTSTGSSSSGSSHSHFYPKPDSKHQQDIEKLLSSISSEFDMDDKKLLKKKPKVDENGVIEINCSDSESDTEEKEEEGERIDGLTISLLPHQTKGVCWMMDRENNEASNGGILADDMGLGKTIQTIGLIVSTMSHDHKITLIVTPLSLIHQWVEEIESKTNKNMLRVLKHHGPLRTKDPSTFNNYDIVVTTYQVVASDLPVDPEEKRKRTARNDNNNLQSIMSDFVEIDETGSVKSLFSDHNSSNDSNGNSNNNTSINISSKNSAIKEKKECGPLIQFNNWHRIVLDEAQQIKNRTTKASISCTELKAKKRWCLTGTPIQNNVEELYSLFRFLRINPLSDYGTFKKTISIPIQIGNTRVAMERLKAVLMATMLRRTKDILRLEKEEEQVADEVISQRLTLKLPTKEKQDIMLEFSQHEQRIYEALNIKSRATIESTNQMTYMNMLCLVLRLRQACNHPKLLLKTIREDKDILEIEDINNMSNNSRVCELCASPIMTGTSESKYCQDCLSSVVKMETQETQVNNESTKIKKLLEILRDTKYNHPGEKTIVFSQFTSMLDLIEEPLGKSGIRFCRYDGSMNSQSREKSLNMLKHDKKCLVMLISLKCGSLGLNLTAANRVILIDIWWNPALEEQAIDRVHRIGQKLPVHVTRLLIQNSIELKIKDLQRKKAQIAQGALGDGLVKNTKLTANEIRSLFNI